MSVDEKHRQKVQDLNNAPNKLNTLHSKRTCLVQQQNETQNIFDRLMLDEQIHDVDIQIRSIKDDTQLRYVFQVYSVLDNHNKSFRPDEQFTKLRNGNGNGKDKEPVDRKHEQTEPEAQEDRFTLTSFVEKKSTNKRGQFLEKYMATVGGSNCGASAGVSSFSHNQSSGNRSGPSTAFASASSTRTPTCVDCGIPMRLAPNESYVVCAQCGNQNVHFEPTVSGLTYEQEVNSDCSQTFAYKRINHLRELLAQLQAKERSEIPPSVIDAVRLEFKKSRMHQASDVTQPRVRSFLKKLGLNKYYEHARQIGNQLSGRPPPVITAELYETLVNMFHDIQEPFERCCPKGRKNFFSYSYILYKFCELLGETEMMTLFPLLKSREKLYQQDCIWRDICQITGWTFYKSV
eukprot:265988-Prorocentrum_minimum.AAC.5